MDIGSAVNESLWWTGTRDKRCRSQTKIKKPMQRFYVFTPTRHQQTAVWSPGDVLRNIKNRWLPLLVESTFWLWGMLSSAVLSPVNVIGWISAFPLGVMMLTNYLPLLVWSLVSHKHRTYEPILDFKMIPQNMPYRMEKAGILILIPAFPFFCLFWSQTGAVCSAGLYKVMQSFRQFQDKAVPVQDNSTELSHPFII